MLGPREDQRVVDVVALQELHQKRPFERAGHRIEGLRDASGRCSFALKGDSHRIAEDLPGENLDRRRHGGAEEERLLGFRHVPEHAPDVRQEAHVQHAIRLVQN